MTSTSSPLAPLKDLTPDDRVVTIGTFDGVHRGHRALIQAAAANASSLGVPLTIITFDPPPAAVLHPERFPGGILLVERKVELLRETGGNDVVVVPFTRQLASVSADEFMRALIDGHGVRSIHVGEGFALGHNREGTVEVLTSIAARYGVDVYALARVEAGGSIVSSSRVRQVITQGEAELASAMLGRWFRTEGEVIRGAQVGRTIGYPTANVLPPDGQVQLADGIYATLTTLNAGTAPLPSMTYIGTRPALNTGRRLIETHILDFDGDLYGQHFVVDFVDRLRPDATFSTVDALIDQLRRDEDETRRVLATRMPAELAHES